MRDLVKELQQQKEQLEKRLEQNGFNGSIGGAAKQAGEHIAMVNKALEQAKGMQERKKKTLKSGAVAQLAMNGTIVIRCTNIDNAEKYFDSLK